MRCTVICNLYENIQGKSGGNSTFLSIFSTKISGYVVRSSFQKVFVREVTKVKGEKRRSRQYRITIRKNKRENGITVLLIRGREKRQNWVTYQMGGKKENSKHHTVQEGRKFQIF